MRRFALLLLVLVGCGGPPQAARDAQYRLSQGDIDGAQRIVDSELARSPREPHMWNLRIRVLLARGDSAGAVAAYRQWRGLHGGDDAGALHAMALTTVWRSLGSGDPQVRAAAVGMAERLNDDRLFDAVVPLLHDGDPVVRATAAAAILRGHADAPAILEEALSGPSAPARAVAVEALGRKVGRKAVADLRHALSDTDENVRAAACDALGRVGDHDSAATLADLALKDPSGSVRASALAALGALRYDPAAETARTELADHYLGARLAALHALEQMLGSGAKDDLTRAAAGKDSMLALRAGVALARRGDRAPGLAALSAALEAKDWTVRAAAANAADDIAAHSDVGKLLAPLAKDGVPEVRLAAARALLHAGDREGAEPIFHAVLDLPSEELRVQAAADLARLGDAKSLQALEALMGSKDPAVRRAAVSSSPTTSPVLDALLAALADEDDSVRLAAAQALL